MGEAASLEEESFERGLLEYPLYTRPQVWDGRSVTEVLLSGHHERIRSWRLAEAEKVTRVRRPDLWTRSEAARSAGEERSAERRVGKEWVSAGNSRWSQSH